MGEIVQQFWQCYKDKFSPSGFHSVGLVIFAGEVAGRLLRDSPRVL
jgi:hypothetical protein